MAPRNTLEEEDKLTASVFSSKEWMALLHREGQNLIKEVLYQYTERS